MSRTAKSIKNARVALIYYFLNLALQFFSRKIFLDYLGAEVLGLNTTAVNLLQFLNLAELGIGAAISYALYKPIADRRYQEINEIVSIQGYLYHKIGCFIIVVAVLLMLFFPYFFADMQLPLWYAYATFIILLLGAIIGYFFNYKQILLTADQKGYKLNYIIQSVKIFKTVFQILAIYYLKNGYIWWLIGEFTSVLITAFAINYSIKREYPWLVTDISLGKLLQKKYPKVLTKTKQLFFHKIATFVLFQSSPLIVYVYGSLTVVAIYGNYMLIITGIIALLNAIFNSINAGVGNLIAEGNKQRIVLVFCELFSSRFLLVVTFCFGVYLLATPFITLWVGPQYLFDDMTLGLLVAILYINTMRSVVDSYINAYGIFQDIFAPILEVCLNIGLSLLLGYFMGIHGILTGILISLIIIVFLWKPYFLFHEALRISIQVYIKMYLKHIIVVIFVGCVIFKLLPFVHIDPKQSIVDFLLYAFVCVGSFGILLLLSLFFVEQGMRHFVRRFIY